MLATVHLEDGVKPYQVPITLIHLSYDVTQVAEHALNGLLKLYNNYQEMKTSKYNKLLWSNKKINNLIK